jgi:hypothetical protein
MHDDEEEAIRYALTEFFNAVVFEGIERFPLEVVGEGHLYTQIVKHTANYI